MRQVLHTASSVPEDDWQSGIVIGTPVIDMAVKKARDDKIALTLQYNFNGDEW
jgi:hypothetical protein